jgi:hypothetical protein
MIAIVLFVLMLGGLSMGLLTEGLAERTAVNHRKTSLLALEICEMGILRAQSEIFSQTDPDDDGIGNVAGPYAGGTYVVTAAQHPTNPDRWTLTASGTFELSTRRVEVGIRRRAGGDFVEGLFSKDDLTFNGRTATDAYDSRLGTYASQLAGSGGDYVLDGGHVGSNGGITLHGSSVLIRGNAIPGPMYQVNMSGGPDVWGDTMARRRIIDLPDIPQAEFEAALASNVNDTGITGIPGGGAGALPMPNGNGKAKGKGKSNAGGNGNGNNSGYDPATYSLTPSSGSTVTLTGGTYFFTDVRFTGQATLRVTGPTVIYVTGDFDLQGGTIMNVSGKPSDLQVYVHPYALPAGHTPSGSRVKINGGSQAALALYGPGADIRVGGNNHVYGSLVGDTIVVAGNSYFHYDKALGDASGHGHVMLERLYWRELSLKLR